MDVDAAGYVAVGYGAAVIVAYDTANVFKACDAGVCKGEVMDVGAYYIAEDALVTIYVAVSTAIDAYAADGLIVAVEVALEGVLTIVIFAAYTLKVVLLARGIVSAIGVRNVITQPEVHARVGCAVVHFSGQQVEIGGVLNKDGVSLTVASRDAAIPCPCRS